jgi:hypothetical protein
MSVINSSHRPRARSWIKLLRHPVRAVLASTPLRRALLWSLGPSCIFQAMHFRHLIIFISSAIRAPSFVFDETVKRSKHDNAMMR